jgi:hypothetical protein
VRTLREYQINRNEKQTPGCAKTVEEVTCLWKGKENGEQILIGIRWREKSNMKFLILFGSSVAQRWVLYWSRMLDEAQKSKSPESRSGLGH